MASPASFQLEITIPQSPHHSSATPTPMALAELHSTLVRNFVQVTYLFSFSATSENRQQIHNCIAMISSLETISSPLKNLVGKVKDLITKENFSKAENDKVLAIVIEVLRLTQQTPSPRP